MPHRPRTAAGKSMTILGLYLAAGLGAAALPFARLPGDWPLFAVAVLLAAAFVVGQQLVWYSWWTQLGGVLTAAAFVFCTGLAAHSSLLSWHGNQVEATVTDVTTAQGLRSPTYVYALRDVQGHRIPGHLSEATAEFRVGDEITVVVDRGDWVDPKTIGEVDTARPFWIAPSSAWFSPWPCPCSADAAREPESHPNGVQAASGSSTAHYRVGKDMPSATATKPSKQSAIRSDGNVKR